MGFQTVRFEDIDLDEGVEVSKMNISPVFRLDPSTVNISMGIYRGVGPRNGMHPIPNHNHNEVQISGTNTAYYTAGIQRSENSTGQAYENRRRIYGILPIQVADYDDYANTSTTYAFLTDNIVSATRYWTVAIGGEKSSLTLGSDYKVYAGGIGPTQTYESYTAVMFYKYTSGMDSGLTPNIENGTYTWEMGSVSAMRLSRFSETTNPSEVITIFDNDKYKNNKFYAPIVGAQVTGGDIPFKNYIMQTFSGTDGKFSFDLFGYSREAQFRNNKTGNSFKVATLGVSSSGGTRLYQSKIYDGQPTYVPTHSSRLMSVNIDTTALTPSTSNDGIDKATISTVSYGLFKNDTAVCNSSYYFFAQASGRPLMGIFHDWIRPTFKDDTAPLSDAFRDGFVQYIDPTEWKIFDLERDTQIDTVGVYTDNGIKRTVFSIWTSFDGVNPIQYEDIGTAEGMVRAGRAGTGVLRANTIYEITCSFYDKTINHETNVGVPAKVLTPSEDNIRLSVFRNTYSGPSVQVCPFNYQNFIFGVQGSTQFDGDVPDPNRWNHIEARFYYRPFGSFEWIPAGFFDMAQFLYDAEAAAFYICQGQIAGLPGGQPGGFNDYSTLPKLNYIDVLWFNSRLFWMSDQQLVYSLLNKPLSYPIRNAITAPKGQFKGMLVQAYPGQAQQDSRLVIFGTQEIYLGRFRGAEYAIQQPVRVSADSVGTFPLDGSDFVVDLWTTVTSYSSRTAVVAEGILYYWGQSGIRVDNGTEFPDRLSQRLEPDFFKYADVSRSDEFFSVYNSRTKEIIWFYRPNPTQSDSQTRAICYNVASDAFYFYDFGEIIVDWAQEIDYQDKNTKNKDKFGKRIVLGIRDGDSLDRNRCVFFDELCLAGDWKPSKSSMCIGTNSVSGTVKRLYLASPYILLPVAGGKFTIYSSTSYTDENIPDFDGVYLISSSGMESVGAFAGKYYVDIDFADVSTLYNEDGDILYNSSNEILYSALYPVTNYNFIDDYAKMFPVHIWQDHEFDFGLVSYYWAGGGINFWGEWLFSHQIYKTDQVLVGQATQVTVKYRSLIGPNNSSIANTFDISNNSKGHFQVHNAIKFNKGNNQGQALSIEVTSPSGKYCGSRWVMQYLAYDVRVMSNDNLRHWEG